MCITWTRTIMALVCVSILVVVVGADTIKLKNGSVIKGKVTSYSEREFTVSLDTGTTAKRTTSRLVLAVDDVESIQFDGESGGAIAFSPETTERPPINKPVNSDVATKPSAEPIKPKPSAPTFSNAPAPSQPTTANDAALGDKSVQVIAAADWTSTELRVKKGQRITISASGQIDLGSNRRSGPEGITVNDPKKLLLNSPTGALIAVVGDDNDEFIPVGASASFVADRDGILFLSVNEANLKDNAGSFTARVKVFSK